MRGFWLLNEIRGRIFANSLRFANRSERRRKILLIFIASVFVIGDYWFFRRVIDYLLLLPMQLWDILIPQFLMVICLTFFSMLVFSSIILSISGFFMSLDLDLLISSPLNVKNVYASRLVQTTLRSSGMLLIFGTPIFVALGVSFGAGAGYYVGMILTIIPFIVIPAGTGVMASVVLMRFFPARKTYQFLSFVGIVFISGLVMFFRFLRPEKFLGKDIPAEFIRQYVENLKIPSYWFLPSTWAANSLEAGMKAEYEQMFSWIAVAWTAAALIVVLNIFIVSRAYYRGWSLAYSGRLGKNINPENRIYKYIELMLPFVPSALRAIVMKDVKIFWRDPSHWTQLFLLGALVVVYIFNIRNLPMNTLILKNFVSVMNVGLAGVVLAAVAVRFVFTATSVEAKSFWIIKTGPVNLSGYLWIKFIFYLLPLLFLSECLIIVSNLFLDVDPFLMIISSGGIFFITVGITGLGIGLGAIFPVFDYDNISELATSTGAIYYMLISLSYIGVVMMFGVRPIWAHFSQKFLFRDVGGFEIYICYAVVILLTAAAVFIPIRAGASALRKKEI